MTKNEIANKLSERMGMPHTKSVEVIETLMSIATDTFKEGHNIYLRGFGTLKVVTRKSRAAQNIGKNLTIMVPTHKTVKFIPSPVVKSALNDL